MARYLLCRVAEDYNVSVSFEPKLFKEWSGAGCHHNFSTQAMREGKGGMEYIDRLLERLSWKHERHLELYGDNSRRLTGEHSPSPRKEFTRGIGDRGASVRIPT